MHTKYIREVLLFFFFIGIRKKLYNNLREKSYTLKYILKVFSCEPQKSQ